MTKSAELIVIENGNAKMVHAVGEAGCGKTTLLINMLGDLAIVEKFNGKDWEVRELNNNVGFITDEDEDLILGCKIINYMTGIDNTLLKVNSEDFTEEEKELIDHSLKVVESSDYKILTIATKEKVQQVANDILSYGFDYCIFDVNDKDILSELLTKLGCAA